MTKEIWARWLFKYLLFMTSTTLWRRLSMKVFITNLQWSILLKTETGSTPHVKSWLIGKDPDARRDWGHKEKGTTEDEMAGWNHQLDEHEFGKIRELVMDRQAWHAEIHGVTKSWTWLSNWTELYWTVMSPCTSRAWILMSGTYVPFSGMNKMHFRDFSFLDCPLPYSRLKVKVLVAQACPTL